MSSYTGTSYMQGQAIPGPPSGPPPGSSRHGPQFSDHHGIHPSSQQQSNAPSSGPIPAPQHPGGPHLAPIPQHRPLPDSQMRRGSYTQPMAIPPSGYGQQQYLHRQHASTAPQQSWLPVEAGTPGSYTFGETGYPPQPVMNPRRHSASSHRSAASHHSGHGRDRRKQDSTGYPDDGTRDSMYDSEEAEEEEEERRRRKRERRKRREAEAARSSSTKSNRDRPTMADSVIAVIDGVKSAFGSSSSKH